MSEADYEMLTEQFDRLRRECDTPEKATEQLKREGLLDSTGRTAELYRDPIEDAAWQ
ncbi:MAG TPA: hypothetical protein VFE38_06550 [Edaphobacter sp.]|nr:hypothetical protein [Edaphobacter sp.]